MYFSSELSSSGFCSSSQPGIGLTKRVSSIVFPSLGIEIGLKTTSMRKRACGRPSGGLGRCPKNLPGAAPLDPQFPAGRASRSKASGQDKGTPCHCVKGRFAAYPPPSQKQGGGPVFHGPLDSVPAPLSKRGFYYSLAFYPCRE